MRCWVLAVAPEEAKKIKELVTNFLYSIHGYSVSNVDFDVVKKETSKITIKGSYDLSGKSLEFTLELDDQYRLLSYERGKSASV